MKSKFETARNSIADAPVDPPLNQPADAELLVAVMQALELDGRVAGEDVAVAVEDGCVSLIGTVSKEYQRVLADACASSVPGVLVVKNQLNIKQKGPMAKTPE